MAQVHHFDETGVYLRSSDARQDPKVPGRPVVPAKATLVAPPAVGERQTARWNGSTWDLVADHRGDTWWRGHGDPVVIEFVGDPHEVGLLRAEPAPPPRLTDAAQAKAELSAGIDAILMAAVGNVPEHEKLSWPVKEAAARRVLADGAAALAEDRAMLSAETAAMGQNDLDAVAGKIVAKANAYRLLIAAASGIRQAAEDRLTATDNPADFERIVDKALALLAEMAEP